MGMRTSDEPSFAGGQPSHPHPAPAIIRPQEERLLPEAQLRRKGRSPEEGAKPKKKEPRVLRPLGS